MPFRIMALSSASVRASCWSPQGLSSGKPVLCESRWRMVIFGESLVGYSSAFSSGTYRSAGSSSDSRPSSRSRMMAIAVKLLVIEAMRNTEPVSTGAFAPTSRRPVTPMCATRSPTTIAQAAPGTCSRPVNSRMMLSMAGKTARSFASLAGSDRPGCWAARAEGSTASKTGTYLRRMVSRPLVTVPYSPISPYLQPAAHTLQQVREDIEAAIQGSSSAS